ncbi:MAG TPA: glutathione S-transferase family protein [Kofleriaceae bacterium]|nr:glutathione S-transferase family protein [Kofleriaceae bacterium]
MSLVFYYSPMSTAVVTHWALEELGIPYEKVKLSIQAGDTKKPDFLKINPNGAVPVIVHDGTPIFESAAIAIYLGETFGVEKGLFPAAGVQRGQATSWIVWANVTLGGAMNRLAYSSSERIPAEQHNAKAAEAARAAAEQSFGVLNDALAGKEWLVGDKFSLVDVHVASFVEYATYLGFDLKKWANVDAWRTRATNRPGHATAMTQ